MDTIWNFLPDIIKHYDIKKIFSTMDNAPNLARMTDILIEHSLTIMIV